MEIDVNDYRKKVLESHSLPLYSKKMIFYYDETGNCRKFTLKDGKVNSQDAVKHDFILGGIAYKESAPKVNIDYLFKELKLQPTQKELKYKHIQGNNKSFIDVIGNRRATILLDWLISNDIFIHFSALNNLYYSLVDIVDSFYNSHQYVLPMIEKELKAALYRFSLNHQDEVLDLFSQFNYPNIERAKCKNFCYLLAEIIEYYNDDSTPEGFYLETLRQMLKTAGRNGELVFLHDNKPEKLIEEYYLFYTERRLLFPDSYHIFDEEPTVQSKFNEIDAVYNGNKLKIMSL